MSCCRWCGPRAIKLAESQGRAFGADNRGPCGSSAACTRIASRIVDGSVATQIGRQAGIHRLKIARNPAPRKRGHPPVEWKGRKCSCAGAGKVGGKQPPKVMG